MESESLVKHALAMPMKLEENVHALEMVLQAQKSEPCSRVQTFKKMASENAVLVSHETPAKKFLEVTNGDAKGAGLKLTKYWECRNKHFDPKSCFLPLTFTGKGALKQSDEEVYKSGFLVNLPDDKEGRPVICYDRSLLEKDFTGSLAKLVPAALRCAFYVLAVAAKQPQSAEKGIVLLIVLQSSPDSFDHVFERSLFDIIGCCPFSSVHKRYASISTFQNSDQPLHCPQLNGGHRQPSDQDFRAQAPSKAALMVSLQTLGFVRAGVPTTLGGTWSYFLNFGKFRREQVGKEELVDAAVAGSLTKKQIGEILSKEENKKRKRELDVMYARRQRQKRSAMKQQLQHTVKKLKADRRELLNENRRLMGLSHSATKVLNNFYEQKRSSLDRIIQRQRIWNHPPSSTMQLPPVVTRYSLPELGPQAGIQVATESRALKQLTVHPSTVSTLLEQRIDDQIRELVQQKQILTQNGNH